MVGGEDRPGQVPEPTPLRRCGRRYIAAGYITNWEIEPIREKNRRNYRWLYVWADVSQPYHATDQAHWEQMKDKPQFEE